MNILVTGGAGFIGGHVVDRLIELNHKCIVVDNLSSGKEENINKKAKFYKGDIRNKRFLEDIFKKEEIDILIHKAAQVDVQESLKYPANDNEINVIGTINLLEMMRKYKIKKIIFSSSVAVYGNQNKTINEKTKTKPLSPYGLSKLTAEKYIQLYSKLYDLNYIIFRYSNVYGPRQNKNGVISIFINNMIKGNKITIYGNGKQTRDFIYVKDIVEATINAINIKKNGIYLLGSGKEISILDLFNLIKEELNFKGEVIFEKEREGDIYKSKIDCNKAINDKVYTPTDLKEGLKKTINSIKGCFNE